MFVFFFFKQKTAYEMRISDWSSDVCSSDLYALARPGSIFLARRSTTRGSCLSGGSFSMLTRRACSIPAAPSRAAVGYWRWASPSACRSGDRGSRAWSRLQDRPAGGQRVTFKKVARSQRPERFQARRAAMHKGKRSRREEGEP